MVRVNAADAASAVLLGGGIAVGLLLVLSAAPRWRARSLADRIAPYVREAVDDDALPTWALPTAGILPVSWRLRDTIVRALGRASGSGQSLDRRLAQAGLELDGARFRGRQLGWSVAGFGAGSAAVLALALGGRMSPPLAVLPILGAAVAALSTDALLSARVAARRNRLADELPTVLEFLALCLSAGESLVDALRRVAGVGSGELTDELRRVVLAIGTGSSLSDALTEMSDRLQLPGLARATDQIVAALEHGAPLAGVLQSQATDAREEARRTLIEQAGRREILMLLPLVFLILPLSVLFAVFPGLFILRLGIG